MLIRLIKEPLIHFLLIGAALFALYGAVSEPKAEADNRIVVTEADVARLAATWQRRWNRPPSADEMNNLIETYIREEILYREAMAMGLQKDDAVVRRRMAQKIEFLFNDIASPADPDDVELLAYMNNNHERFMTPARYSFSHVYLSVDKRGHDARTQAERLLQMLKQQGGDADAVQFSDLFMFDYQFSDVSDYEVSRIFGEQFAGQLGQLSVGEWQGPIDSGYGLHLVILHSRVAATLPPLTDIRERVVAEFTSEKQREANQRIYQSMRERYDVVVESPGGQAQSVAMRVEDDVVAP